MPEGRYDSPHGAPNGPPASRNKGAHPTHEGDHEAAIDRSLKGAVFRFGHGNSHDADNILPSEFNY